MITQRSHQKLSVIQTEREALLQWTTKVFLKLCIIHSIISQKTELFRTTNERTSNPTYTFYSVCIHLHSWSCGAVWLFQWLPWLHSDSVRFATASTLSHWYHVWYSVECSATVYHWISSLVSLNCSNILAY
jgi:hypothetical protein